MKIKSKKKSILIIVIVVIALIAILTLAGVFVGKTVTEQQQEEENREVRQIAISIVPNLNYYVGDTFDPTGLKIQVIAGANDYSYFVEYPNSELILSGFDSSVPNDALPITVTYQGFTATFNVSIKEKPVPPTTKKELVSIKLSDNFNTTYSKNDWNFFGPTLDEVDIICTFSDGTEERVDMLYGYIKNPNLNLSVGTYDLIIEYTHGTKTVSTTVTITITE